jgi:pimeloyl-ACP methyl ester carboxylesterase
MSEIPADKGFLLAGLEGKSPPQSAWLAGELAKEPERSTIHSNGSNIELMVWGEVGAPGVMLLHGMGAHAEWWRFIAPALATQYRVAAISWPGMGRSQWRERYELPAFARDIMAGVEAAQLEESEERPVLVGHSFGGLPLLQAAHDYPDRVCGGIMVDSFIPRGNRPSKWASGREAMPVYPTVEAALARYRFAPLQTAEHLDIVDFIARTSLREVEGGWTWCFDPSLRSKLNHAEADVLLDRVERPIAVLYGDRSALVGGDMISQMVARLPNCPIVAGIPDAAHHVMVDQPMAVIAALRVAVAALRSGAGYR